MNRSIVSANKSKTTDADIVSSAGSGGVGSRTPDDYFDRLVKYIPAEVVSLYLMWVGLIDSIRDGEVYLWLLFLICLVGTFFYLQRVLKVYNWKQLLISCVAFVVWAFALGGPFREFNWYQQQLGALALGVYTFSIPIIDPK